MPLWVKIYATIYLLFVVSNLGYLLYIRSKLWLILYDFSSGLYLSFLMLAYWSVKLNPTIGLIHVPFFVAIIAIEVYLTVWGRLEDMGLKLPDISEKDAELAKAVSILFSAPAYISGGLLCFDVVTRSLK